MTQLPSRRRREPCCFQLDHHRLFAYQALHLVLLARQVCDGLPKPPCPFTAGARSALPPPALCQGLAVLAQELIHFRVRRAQQGCFAEGPRQDVLDVRLRQRLVLQQHLGQAVQVLLLLRLQAKSSCTSTWHSLLA